MVCGKLCIKVYFLANLGCGVYFNPVKLSNKIVFTPGKGRIIHEREGGVKGLG